MNNKMKNALEDLKPKERKKSVNSKSKGKTFEYEVANSLSIATGMPFQRIFASGASVGQSNRGRLINMTNGQAITQLGDITSPELLKQLIIWECKNYQSVDLHLLLSAKGSKQIEGWLSELLYDVESAIVSNITDKIVWGFLCIKWTRKGSWIIFNKNLLNNYFIDKEQFFNYDIPSLQFNYNISDTLVDNNWGNEFIMTDFEEFINKYHKLLFQLMTEDEAKLQTINNMQRELDRLKK